MAQALPKQYQFQRTRPDENGDPQPHEIGVSLGTLVGIAHHAIHELDLEVQELRKQVKELQSAK
jgi:hypothetical protein